MSEVFTHIRWNIDIKDIDRVRNEVLKAIGKPDYVLSPGLDAIVNNALVYVSPEERKFYVDINGNEFSVATVIAMIWSKLKDRKDIVDIHVSMRKELGIKQERYDFDKLENLGVYIDLDGWIKEQKVKDFEAKFVLRDSDLIHLSIFTEFEARNFEDEDLYTIVTELKIIGNRIPIDKMPDWISDKVGKIRRIFKEMGI